MNNLKKAAWYRPSSSSSQGRAALLPSTMASLFAEANRSVSSPLPSDLAFGSCLAPFVVIVIAGDGDSLALKSWTTAQKSCRRRSSSLLERMVSPSLAGGWVSAHRCRDGKQRRTVTKPLQDHNFEVRTQAQCKREQLSDNLRGHISVVSVSVHANRSVEFRPWISKKEEDEGHTSERAGLEGHTFDVAPRPTRDVNGLHSLERIPAQTLFC